MCHAETATGEMTSSSNGNPSIPAPPGPSTYAAFARPPSPPQAQPPSPPPSSMGAASDAFGSSSSLAAADTEGWHDADDAMSQEVICLALPSAV